MLRSLLFCPADSPAKLARALGSGADALILDLEDSVALERKSEARMTAAAFLRDRPASGAPELWVRINPIPSSLADEDLAAVLPARPDGIVLPKPDSAAEVADLAERLDRLERASGVAPGTTRILPIVTETPRALFRLDTYVDASPRIAGLTWGAEDLSAAVGASDSRAASGELFDLFRLARALCLAAAAAADVSAIETVWTGFRDLSGLEVYGTRGRQEGFSGMLAIHPDQVAVINRVFSPTEAELAEARRLVALFEANPEAAALSLDGRMVDIPHLKRARRLLARGD